MDLLKAIFGRTADDVEEFSKEGYPFALCLDDPDALDVAVQTAEGRHQIAREDMRYSPPYPDQHCPGYLVLKDEDAAVDIQREVIRTGFECTLAKNNRIVPWLGL